MPLNANTSLLDNLPPIYRLERKVPYRVRWNFLAGMYVIMGVDGVDGDAYAFMRLFISSMKFSLNK